MSRTPPTKLSFNFAKQEAVSIPQPKIEKESLFPRLRKLEAEMQSTKAQIPKNLSYIVSKLLSSTDRPDTLSRMRAKDIEAQLIAQMDKALEQQLSFFESKEDTIVEVDDSAKKLSAIGAQAQLQSHNLFARFQKVEKKVADALAAPSPLKNQIVLTKENNQHYEELIMQLKSKVALMRTDLDLEKAKLRQQVDDEDEDDVTPYVPVKDISGDFEAFHEEFMQFQLDFGARVQELRDESAAKKAKLQEFSAITSKLSVSVQSLRSREEKRGVLLQELMARVKTLTATISDQDTQRLNELAQTIEKAQADFEGQMGSIKQKIVRLQQ